MALDFQMVGRDCGRRIVLIIFAVKTGHLRAMILNVLSAASRS
jgi:hypothetical protein